MSSCCAGRLAPGSGFAVVPRPPLPCYRQAMAHAHEAPACSSSTSPLLHVGTARGRWRKADWETGATGQQAAGGGQARARKMEADLDAVLVRFAGLGQPKPKVVQPPAAGSSNGTAGKQAKSQQQQRPQQQQPAGKALKQSSKGEGVANRGTSSKATRHHHDDKEEMDEQRLWREVDAAVLRASSGEARQETSINTGTGCSQPSSSGSSSAARKGGSSQPFKGFGPSPEEVQAGIQAALAASSKGHASAGGRGSTRQPPLRVFLYSLDEAGTREAIAAAGLQDRVVVDSDVKQCVAVLTAKEGRSGKRIHAMQGERMAANAGLPFICVGRRMTGPNLRAALQPLLSGKGTMQQQQPALRDMAGAAVRAAKCKGFFTLPAPSQQGAEQASIAHASATHTSATAVPASEEAPSSSPAASHASRGATQGFGSTESHVSVHTGHTAPQQPPGHASHTAQDEDEDDEIIDDLELLVEGLHLSSPDDYGDTDDEEEGEERQLVGSANGRAATAATGRRMATRPRPSTPKLRLGQRAR